mmetsp:Transcript_20164/g.80479  ORF Transcript_20164/g.80479 Transcript_20164/m.80479 type:complete len:536 (+) Transcript_20164:1159-2766(+)
MREEGGAPWPRRSARASELQSVEATFSRADAPTTRRRRPWGRQQTVTRQRLSLRIGRRSFVQTSDRRSALEVGVLGDGEGGRRAVGEGRRLRRDGGSRRERGSAVGSDGVLWYAVVEVGVVLGGAVGRAVRVACRRRGRRIGGRLGRSRRMMMMMPGMMRVGVRVRRRLDLGGLLRGVAAREVLHERRDRLGEGPVEVVEGLALAEARAGDFGKGREVEFLRDLCEALDVGEVARAEAARAADGAELGGHRVDEFLLFAVEAVDGGHALLEVVEEVDVGLEEARSFDELVDAAQRRLMREVAEVRQEVGHLGREEGRRVGVLELLVVERPHVDAADFGRLEDFAERPHERAVDAHELLLRHLVRLVEHDADLVLVALEALDDRHELVGDVEFERVKKKDDEVDALGEPLDDDVEVVQTRDALLFARQDARRVDERQVLEERRVAHRALEPRQEVVALALQRAERRVWRDGERVPRDGALVLAVHDRDEPIGRRFRSHALAGERAAEEVVDEGRLPHRVRAHEEDHRRRAELGLVQ